MHETWDGTYTFLDLLEAHDLLDYQHESQLRADEHARKEPLK